MREKKTRDRIAAVDAVLWDVWDPIGVNDVEEARDEYSNYAPAVLRLLDSGASDDRIERHLNELVRVSMGMRPIDPERTRRTLAALRALAE
jgi:hypothetical protein